MGVSLKEGYTPWNFAAIPLTLSTVTYAGTFMNVAIIFLLRDTEYYGIPENEIGRVTNDIIFYSQLLQIGFTLMVGYIYDLVGRRLTIFGTMIPGAIMIMFIPHVAPSIQLLIAFRIAIVMSLSALASHPFTNDYVKKETRGRAIAFQSAGVIVGDLMTFLIVLNLTRSMTPEGRFLTFGLTLIGIAFIFLTIVREPRFKEKRHLIEVYEQKTLYEKIKDITSQVITLCKSDLVFPICLFGTMTARTVHYLFGTFLMLYVSQEVPDRGKAEDIIQKLNVSSVIATLLIVVPAGRIADKLPAKILIPLAFFGTSVALILFQFMGHPEESIYPLYGLVIAIMVTSVFATTCIETVYSRNLPKEVRGTMNGVQTFCGTIGGLIFAKVGGYMFDIYGPKSPFLFVACVNLIFVAFVMIIVIYGKFKH